MSTSSVSVKWNHFGTHRRFPIQTADIGDIYEAMLSQIRLTVPDFDDSLAWKGKQSVCQLVHFTDTCTDADGDTIVFSTALELNEAIQAMRAGETLRIESIAKGLEFSY